MEKPKTLREPKAPLLAGISPPRSAAAPAILSAAIGAGFCLSMAGAVASPSPWPAVAAAAAVGPLCALLAGFAWAVRARGDACRGRVVSDRVMLGELSRNSRDVVEALGIQRARALAAAEGQRAPGPKGEGEPEPLFSQGGDGENPVRAALEAVRLRFVAGLEPDLEVIDTALAQSTERRVEPLSRLADLAILTGFAGTLLGLAVQGFIAQNDARAGLFSASFLTGSLLALTTTLLGMGVALYARGLARRLRGDLEQLCGAVLRWLAAGVLPACGAEARQVMDMRGALEHAVQGLRAGLEEMVERMEQHLRGAAGEAAGRLESFVAAEREATIQKVKLEIVTPFRVEMGKLHLTLKSVEASVAAGAAGLTRAAEVIEARQRGLLETPDGVARDLRAAASDVSALTGGFEAVAGRAAEAASALQEAGAQAALSLERLWGLDALQANRLDALLERIAGTVEAMRTLLEACPLEGGGNGGGAGGGRQPLLAEVFASVRESREGRGGSEGRER